MSEPKKNTAFTFITQLVSQANSPDFQANPTLAAGDVTVSIDGANPANITTLPTAINSGKNVKVSLSAAEMNGEYIAVLFSDAAGAEWHDTAVNINTVLYDSEDLYTNVVTTTTNLDNTSVEYTAYSGDDYTYVVLVVGSDGSTPVNVSDATEITYIVAESKSATSAEYSKTLGAGEITVTNGSGTGDKITVTIDSADTASLNGRYYHEMQVEDSANDKQTILSGFITILQDFIS